jgi:hypothetical protein
MSEDELMEQMQALMQRVADLEERVARLENRQVPDGPILLGNRQNPDAAPLDIGGDIAAALETLGEADAAAIRQHLVKNGAPASLARSDINKALYANKAKFEVVRQEGVKPIWRLVKE